jgi:uncharacterized repeat protein (TIGR01451 family)
MMAPLQRRSNRRRPLEMERLEGRQLLAQFTVSTVDDNVPGSLRQAIIDANNTLGPDSITFTLPAGSSIRPTSQLPDITDPLNIESSVKIEIDGRLAGPGASGLVIRAGSSSVRGLVIGHFTGYGLVLIGGGASKITGTFIGTTVAGNAANPNQLDGIRIINSNGNVIGGVLPTDINVVSGNNRGGISLLNSNGNRLLNNYVGTTSTGQGNLANANGDGISLTNSHANQIGVVVPTPGGGTTIVGNVASANGANGIALRGGSSQNLVQGNRVGLSQTGASLPNGDRGIVAEDALSNRIGGAGTLGNVVSGNGSDGIALLGASDTIVQGNLVGLDPAGLAARANQASGILVGRGSQRTLIVANTVSGNAQEGISIINGATAGTLVMANRIGLSSNGSILGNGSSGVFIQHSQRNTVGGVAAAAGNLIAANALDGITLDTTLQNVIQGNRIQGNLRDGISVENVASTAIGGVGAGQGNLVINNRRNGVTVLSGFSNPIIGNSIFDNFRLGIGLGPQAAPPAPRANDAGDGDDGGNRLQNKPILTAVFTSADQIVPGTSLHQRLVSVVGTLNSTPNQVFTIHLYGGPVGARGAAQGRDFLGSTTAVTDAAGNAVFLAPVTITSATTTAVPAVITATATDVAGNTSEFSTSTTPAPQPAQSVLALALVGAPPTASPGDAVTYTYVVTNNGPGFATGVALTDAIPGGHAFLGGTASQGAVVPGGGVTTALIGNLAPGASATVALTYRVDVEGTQTHTVVARGNDPGNTGGTAPVVVPIVVTPPLRLNSIAWNTPRRGGTRLLLTYSKPLNAASATNAAFYRVAQAGRDRRFGTRDDRFSAIRSISLDPSGTVATIQLGAKLNRRQRYQLTVTSGAGGGVLDAGGRLLDGDRNGIPGGDVVVLLVSGGTTQLG